jgi:hypothetical protein
LLAPNEIESDQHQIIIFKTKNKIIYFYKIIDLSSLDNAVTRIYFRYVLRPSLQLGPRHRRMVLKLREKGWIVILRQLIPTSPLSLWYGTFPREEFSMADAGSRKSECRGLTSYAWKILVLGIDGYWHGEVRKKLENKLHKFIEAPSRRSIVFEEHDYPYFYSCIAFWSSNSIFSPLRISSSSRNVWIPAWTRAL